MAYAKKKININNVYVDRRFFNVKCIQVLQKHKVKWLMPVVQNIAIKKLMKEHDTPKILDYVMGRKNSDQAKFRLVIVNDQDGVKRVFATNLNVKEENAQYLFDLYGKKIENRNFLES